MRKNRRIAALLTAGLLALTPCVSAGMMFASAADDNSISITPAIAGTHNYAAYQIFKGTLSGTGAVDNPATTDVDESDPYVLSDIKWGDSIDSTAFLAALKDDAKFVTGTPAKNIFEDADDAEEVAEILQSSVADKSDMANEFAKLAGKYLKKGTTDPTKDIDPIKSVSTADATTKKYEIDELPAGYYLVRDEAPITDGENANPRTLNLLRVAGAVEMTTKEDLPTIDKKIDEYGGIAANTASVGDIVPYIIKTKVPDMTGYTKYFFVLNDTLSEGLTYQNDLSITVNGTSLVKDTDYTVETNGTTAIKVVFMNFYEKYKGLNDDNPNNDDIIVKYSAKVNEKADMTQTGNINTAQLTYSNNPNINPRGENEPAPPEDEDNPDTPEDETKPNPTGQTPQIKTVTYVTQIDLTKTKADGKTPLAGAKFKLEGYMKTVGAVDGTYYMEDEEGTFYRLADGKYTETAPNGTTSKAYESTNKKYKVVAASDIPAESKISKEVTTGTDGKINFAGLGEGTYTITETAAPSGFNMLKNPITVTITANGTIEGCEWGYVLDDGDNNATTSSGFVQGDSTNQSKLPLTVKNIEGSTLPSTGGVGTKLFYLFGGMLAVGSGVVLVTKKRMSYEK